VVESTEQGKGGTGSGEAKTKGAGDVWEGQLHHLRHELDFIFKLFEAFLVHLLVVQDLDGHAQTPAAALVDGAWNKQQVSRSLLLLWGGIKVEK